MRREERKREEEKRKGRERREEEGEQNEGRLRARAMEIACGVVSETKSACSLEGGKKKWWLGGMSERIRTAGSLVELIFKIVCIFRDYNR